MKKVFISFSVMCILFFLTLFLHAQTFFLIPDKYCLSCHHGIAPIRQHNSGMMKEIYGIGEKAGDPNGCIVCHGGNPLATKTTRAHKGTVSYFLVHNGPKNFYPDPVWYWIEREKKTGDYAVSLMHHTAEVAGIRIHTEAHACILDKVMLMGAWLQVLTGLLIGLVVLYLVYRFWTKKRKACRS